MSRSVSDLIALAAVQAPFAGWAMIVVSGRHRERFLHSQVTSDVVELEVGTAHLSALLDRTGRLQAFFFLGKLDDSMVLLVPEAAAADLGERLKAHVISDDVEIARREVGPMLLALGPEAVRRAAELPRSEVVRIEALGSRGFITWARVELPFETATDAELEARSVVSGFPRWGVEADRGMLINETSLVDTAVSFTKGCFLGQETVAKLASHRGPAYHPVLLMLDRAPSDLAGLVGRSFSIGGRDRAGVIRSWARWQEQDVLQASMFRDFRVQGIEVECEVDDGAPLAARVALLPLLPRLSPAEEAERLFGAAVAAFAADREAEAIDLLERLIAVCPGHADAYESLGVILGRHGRYEEAIELMKRLLEVDPGSVMAHSNMSLYHNRLGRIEDAEREALAAAAKERERHHLVREQAAAERLARQRTAADLRRREEMFARVLEIDPDDGFANLGMGEVCVELGRFEDAVMHLEKVIELDEKHTAAYLALGRALEGMRRPDRARQVYEQGILVATKRGDLAAASTMQGRLGSLVADTDSLS